MFAVLLKRRGKPQKFVRIDAVGRQYIDELGLALGESAGLINDEDGGLFQSFQRFGVFHEHPFLRAAADRRP